MKRSDFLKVLGLGAVAAPLAAKAIAEVLPEKESRMFILRDLCEGDSVMVTTSESHYPLIAFDGAKDLDEFTLNIDHIDVGTKLTIQVRNAKLMRRSLSLEGIVGETGLDMYIPFVEDNRTLIDPYPTKNNMGWTNQPTILRKARTVTGSADSVESFITWEP